MFVVSSEGVIAVDPLPNLGPRYLKAIAEVTEKPITHVIYSHEHTDHIGAAYLFPQKAVFIAQRRTAEILAHRKTPRRPVPTLTFDKSYKLVSVTKPCSSTIAALTTKPEISLFMLRSRRF